MIELTNADRAFIRSLADKWHQDHMLNACREAMHYGLAAGIERSAKVVEGGRFLTDTAPIKLWADECATAIRALLNPPA